MKITRAFVVMLIAQTYSIAAVQTQSPNPIGQWNVEIALADGKRHSLRFDAQGDGKGTLLLLDPISKVWGVGTPSEAKWSLGKGNSVIFSGPVEFLIGNVGRDAGMLECRGKFETPDLITGDVEFSPLAGQRAFKHGTFKAVRAE